MQRLNVDTGKVINHYFFGTTRNILLGLSLGYAVQNEKYYHIPIIFFVHKRLRSCSSFCCSK